MRKLANKIAVVTGAGSGLGQALALRLAEQGVKLALADIDPENLKHTVEIAENMTEQVRGYTLDVSDRVAVENFAQSVLQDFGGLDILINNAGVGLSDTVEDMDYDDFDWVMSVNFWGVVYGCKSFLPALRQAKDAAIVNISSLFGLIAAPSQSAYNSSKFAVRGFTEALRAELAGSSVQVLCVHPGGIKTNIARNARFHRDMTGDEDREKAIQEFDRMALSSPDEAAATIVQAIKKRQDRVLVGPDAWVLDKLQRVFPGGYDRVLRYVIQRVKLSDRTRF